MKQQGTVREWRGTFGFVTYRDDSGFVHNVFVHFRDMIDLDGGYRSLSPGDVVEFEVEEGPKGKHAVRVQVLEPAESVT